MCCNRTFFHMLPEETLLPSNWNWSRPSILVRYLSDTYTETHCCRYFSFPLLTGLIVHTFIIHLNSLVRQITIMCQIWTRGILTELSLCYCVAFQQFTLHNHYEQFFQVGLLDRALISLGLALNPPSICVSSDFMVLCKFFFC